MKKLHNCTTRTHSAQGCTAGEYGTEQVSQGAKGTRVDGRDNHGNLPLELLFWTGADWALWSTMLRNTDGVVNPLNFAVCYGMNDKESFYMLEVDASYG